MIYQHKAGNWKWRALSKRIGYIAPLLRPTSLAIPVVMNDELAEMQARRRAAQTDLDYTNRPDHAWIGAVSPDDHSAMAIGELA